MSKATNSERKETKNIRPMKEKKEIFPIDRPIHVNLAADPLVLEACVVAFFVPGMADAISSFSVSRPVGKTAHPQYSWVVNKVKDLPDLKLRAKNPNFARLEALRQELKSKMLVDGGFLAVSKGGELTLTAKTSVPLEGQKYRGYLDRAKQELESEKAKAKTDWEEKYKSRPKTMRPKFAFVKTLDAYLSTDETNARARIAAGLIELKYEEKAEEAYPDRHVTMVDGVKPQAVLRPVTEDWGWYKPASMLHELAQQFFLFAQGEREAKEKADANLVNQVSELKKSLDDRTAQVEHLKAGSTDAVVSGLQMEVIRLKAELDQTRAERDELQAHLESFHPDGEEEEEG